MTKTLEKFNPENSNRRLKQFQDEMEHIDKGLFMANVGSGLRMKAFWNISRHELYKADGHKSMKAFVESTGYSYRRVTQLIQEGDTLAELVFGADVLEENRWLSIEHVKMYATAKQNAKLLMKHDTLRLPDGADDSVMHIEKDDVESVLELNQLTDAFLALPRGTSAEKALTEGTKKDKRDDELENLIQTLHNSAIQSIAVAHKGGWGRSVKKKAAALYYSRLTFYMLTHDKENLPWCDYESAQEYLTEPMRAQTPAHVHFALGLADD